MREIDRKTRHRRVRHVLSISPSQDDHAHITNLLIDPLWIVHQAACLPTSLFLLRSHPVGVVVCERELSRETWVDVLDTIRLLRDAPPLIVASRLADERLWAEALNLGAYDVLAKPFDPQELNRSLNLAFLHWRHRHDAAPALEKVMRMAR